MVRKKSKPNFFITIYRASPLMCVLLLLSIILILLPLGAYAVVGEGLGYVALAYFPITIALGLLLAGAIILNVGLAIKAFIPTPTSPRKISNRSNTCPYIRRDSTCASSVGYCSIQDCIYAVKQRRSYQAN